jgi:hypothetical protein
MTRILAIAEHVIADDKNTETTNDWAKRMVAMDGRVIHETEGPSDIVNYSRIVPQSGRIHVDSLVERFRAHEQS